MKNEEPPKETLIELQEELRYYVENFSKQEALPDKVDLILRILLAQAEVSLEKS